MYVHCRAGIGRTGTVIGCLLAERGSAGDAALQELNGCGRPMHARRRGRRFRKRTSRWRTCGSWARAAECRAPLTSGAPDLRERFLGALLGLAVGDALGAATQGAAPGTFTPVDDLLGGGTLALPRGAWSDDTAMALCLAESLLERDGFDARDQMQRYGRWQAARTACPPPARAVGITASTARALALARWQRKLFAGSHDPKQLDPEPLSRVAPAVMFFFASPDGRGASGLRGRAHHLPGAARARMLPLPSPPSCTARSPANPRRAFSSRPRRFSTRRALNPRLLRSWARRPSRDMAPRAHAVDRALAAALWAFRSTDNFRAGALRAANLGGSSDVITAVFGALAGAHYGVSAIPEPWRAIFCSRT